MFLYFWSCRCSLYGYQSISSSTRNIGIMRDISVTTIEMILKGVMCRYLPLIYFVWMAYDIKTPARGSRPWEWLRRARIWRWFRDYFPVTLVKTTELDPETNYIFGYITYNNAVLTKNHATFNVIYF